MTHILCLSLFIHKCFVHDFCAYLIYFILPFHYFDNLKNKKLTLLFHNLTRTHLLVCKLKLLTIGAGATRPPLTIYEWLWKVNDESKMPKLKIFFFKRDRSLWTTKLYERTKMEQVPLVRLKASTGTSQQASVTKPMVWLLELAVRCSFSILKTQ